MLSKCIGISLGKYYLLESYASDKLRMTYATSMKNLETAMKRIEGFIKSF